MFLFLQGLIVFTLSAQYLFDKTRIPVNTVSTGTITTYSSSTNTCSKLIARTNGLYHISTEDVFNLWAKGNLSTTINTTNVTAGAGTVKDFGVATS